ncbi:MAG: TetR/AcrR family transcriptional regulator [Pseudomonadota bacterium]
MVDTRASNMAERRERILQAACTIIAEKGVEGLTTRGLAAAANVTAPTLYNLIGGKEDIIRELINENVEEVWAELDFEAIESPSDMADHIIDTVYDQIMTDGAYVRATVIASEEIPGAFAARGDMGFAHGAAGQRSAEMAITACRAALAKGMLQGTLSPEILGLQMFISYRGPLRDWAHGVISPQEMRRRQLRGFYLVLAADAAPDFRASLLGKLAALEEDEATNRAACEGRG